MIGGKYVEMFHLGLRNMWGYKLRSFLSVLGISFGIASVIAMLATGEGAKRKILEQMGRLGIRNIIANSVKPSDADQAGSGATSWISRYGLTFRDWRQIEETVPTAQVVLPVHDRKDRVWIGSRHADARMHGVRPEHLDLLQLEVVAGRGLTTMDNIALNRVCVIRPGLLKALGCYEAPLGQRLLVGEDFYEVVGVLAEEEFTTLRRKALNADNRSLELYAPYDTVLGRHGTMSIVRKSGSFEATDVELHQIVVEVDEQENVLSTARMIERILERFHPDQDYELIVPLELIEQRRQTQKVFSFVLFVVGLISLVVGGIGIMNIMLASITERTREIGIRRAIGAKRRHIVAQFLTETVSLSAAGGMLGLLLGFVLVALLEHFAGWTAVIAPGVVLLAIGISCLVGVLAGLWPAFQAARMDPIVALRYE